MESFQLGCSGDVSRLLETNYSPTPTERRVLQDIIEIYKKKLAHLDLEMDGSNTRLKELRLERDDIKAKLQHAEGLLSPVRRLPAEIMSRIFGHASHRADLDYICIPEEIRNTSSKDAVFILPRVCRLWRHIALGTPTLFTQISFMKGEALNPLVIIPFWLKRSGTLPLVLCIDPTAWNRFAHPDDPPSRNFFQLVREHMHRITALTLSFGTYLKFLFPSETITHLPALKQLKLVTVSTNDEFSEAVVQVGNILVKNITSLLILVDTPWQDYLLVGDKLTHFEGNLGPSEALFVLSEYSNLEQCVINYIEYPDEKALADQILSTVQSLSSIKLLHLTTLFITLFDGDSSCILHILPKLFVPKLLDVKIAYYHYHCLGYISNEQTDLVLMALSTVFIKSQVKLRTLELTFGLKESCSQSRILTLLRAIPTLETLTFESSVINKQTLAVLDREQCPGICPSLTTLVFGNSRVQLNELLTLVRNRMGPSRNTKVLERLFLCDIQWQDRFNSTMQHDTALRLLHELEKQYPELKLSNI